MKISVFSVFFALCLGSMAMTSPAFADLKMAHEVEGQKVHFESSDFRLSPDAKIILDQTVTLLARMNESYSLKVLGYTDSHGSEDLNQTLSVQRANAVAAYFISKGIERDRILIQGKAAEQPLASNETEEGRNINRRVEFKFITPDTTQLKLTASNDLLVAQAPKEEEIIGITPQAEELKTGTQPSTPQPTQAPEVKQDAGTSPPPSSLSKKIEQKAEEEQQLEHAPVRVSDERRERGTMLVSDKKKKSVFYRNHIYEDRKRGDQGQAYAQITPMLLKIGGASNLGAPDDSFSTQLSFRGELGWTTFLEDDSTNYFSAKGYGSFIRVEDNAGNNVATTQKQLPFGGELALGRYFHPNVALQVQSGYGKELNYHLTGGSIEFDTDYMWHAGMSAEIIAWRFSHEGDIGIDGFFNYYDFGKRTLDSGNAVGASIFVDYEFLRAGFGITKMHTETTSFKFNMWQFGPNFRLYF